MPGLWWHEVGNALVVARRRKRVTESEHGRLLYALCHLPLRTDGEDPAGVLERATALAAGHGLSSYDAAYLELAIRKGLGLATLDDRLARAARDAGVTIHEPRPA